MESLHELCATIVARPELFEVKLVKFLQVMAGIAGVLVLFFTIFGSGRKDRRIAKHYPACFAIPFTIGPFMAAISLLVLGFAPFLIPDQVLGYKIAFLGGGGGLLLSLLIIKLSVLLIGTYPLGSIPPEGITEIKRILSMYPGQEDPRS